jgi:hypothetical protein
MIPIAYIRIGRLNFLVRLLVACSPFFLWDLVVVLLIGKGRKETNVLPVRF